MALLPRVLSVLSAEVGFLQARGTAQLEPARWGGCSLHVCLLRMSVIIRVCALALHPLPLDCFPTSPEINASWVLGPRIKVPGHSGMFELVVREQGRWCGEELST